MGDTDSRAVNVSKSDFIDRCTLALGCIGVDISQKFPQIDISFYIFCNDRAEVVYDGRGRNRILLFVGRAYILLSSPALSIAPLSSPFPGHTQRHFKILLT